MRSASLIVAAALMASPSRASADPGVAWSDDVPVTIMVAAAWLALEGIGDAAVGSRCGWCSGPGPADRWFRSWLLGPDPSAAAIASDVLLYAAVPGLALVADLVVVRASGQGWTAFAGDVTIMAEAFAVTALATRAVKLSVRRTRPYALYGGDDPLYREGSRDVTGFFSGHASYAACLAASAATLAFMRGSRAAPWIAAAGAALAVTVGTLRITADKHYFSDVATGLAVGAAVGILVPLLHVRRAPVAIAPAPGGVSVSGAF